MLQVWVSLLIYVHGRVNPSDVISWDHACSILKPIPSCRLHDYDLKSLMMEDLTPLSEQPDFSTLTGIMERFYHVPYEQFQRELDDWFTGNLREKGMDLNTLQQNGFPGMPNLISSIYHRAEVLQTLFENQIKTDHEDK